MSRSNPTTNEPNPCKRWLEWDGANGSIRYYDKTQEKSIDIGHNFTFILLDELGCVKGWHDASDSGIYSNEVRDGRQEVMVVRSFKGGTLAEGFYKDIRDRVKAMGGHYTTNCYLAYRNEAGELALGAIQFKGAALNAWVEFRKQNQSDVYAKAVQINGFEEGKKGKVTFRVPKFSIKQVSEETNGKALELDKVLQKYLSAYLSRTKTEQVAKPSHVEPEAFPQSEPEPPADTQEIEACDDVPF